MWSNKGKKLHYRSANIKSHLGGFHGLNVYEDETDSDIDSHTKETENFSSSVPNTQSQVSVLVEIPEEFDLASRYEEDADRYRYPSTRGKQQQKEQENCSGSANTNDSAAVAEIGNNLMDLDNYMLSVFHMNDDASVYTKATADTTLSSSNSSSSSVSTRRRHRGAFRNRKREIPKNEDGLQQRNVTNRNEKGNSWLESMKRSSMNMFVDGEDDWTPSKGWSMDQKNPSWDLKPDGHWNDINPIFDSIKKERLEI
jgi:hypothetical protein